MRDIKEKYHIEFYLDDIYNDDYDNLNQINDLLREIDIISEMEDA